MQREGRVKECVGTVAGANRVRWSVVWEWEENLSVTEL